MDISIGGANTYHGKNALIFCVSRIILIGFAFEIVRNRMLLELL